jgi:hypothetical protein
VPPPGERGFKVPTKLVRGILLLLRKVGACCRIIGEAYVHGFMDGEAIRLMKKGELEVKAIDII